MENTIDIYTDSSHYHGCNKRKHLLGYSGVILGEDRNYVLKGTIKRRTLKEYFGLNVKLESISIEHGELLSICKTLWQFRKESHSLRIFSDSLNGLKKIQRVLSGEKISKKSIIRNRYQNLIDYIVSLIEKIESNGGSVEMLWVRGHAGCYGNNIADKMAKDISVPNIENLRRMSSKQKEKFKTLSPKDKNIYNKTRMDHYYLSKISNNSDDFFFTKELNEFKDYKKTLMDDSRKSYNGVGSSFISVVRSIMDSFKKYNYKPFLEIENGNTIPKYL